MRLDYRSRKNRTFEITHFGYKISLIKPKRLRLSELDFTYLTALRSTLIVSIILCPNFNNGKIPLNPIIS